eukprot:763440-Hanusia_phi.AAC.2
MRQCLGHCDKKNGVLSPEDRAGAAGGVEAETSQEVSMNPEAHSKMIYHGADVVRLTYDDLMQADQREGGGWGRRGSQERLGEVGR